MLAAWSQQRFRRLPAEPALRSLCSGQIRHETLCAALQKLLLQVMGHKRLLESHDDVMLLQKIQLRAPYVTPLNVLQVTIP